MMVLIDIFFRILRKDFIHYYNSNMVFIRYVFVPDFKTLKI